MSKNFSNRLLPTDTNVLISLGANCLSWVLKKLHETKNVVFLITEDVYKELIDRPFKYDYLKLEIFRYIDLIDEGVIKIVDHDITNIAHELGRLANNTYFSHGENIKILHRGELSLLAIAKTYNLKFISSDEVILRLFLEKPLELKNLLERRLHTYVDFSRRNWEKVIDFIGRKVRVLRSAELLYYAFKIGLFDNKINTVSKYIKNARYHYLRGLLYAVKNKGCGISGNEIESYLRTLF